MTLVNYTKLFNICNILLNVCNRYRAKSGIDKKSILSFSDDRVTETFLPIMEALFKLPGRGLAEGTPGWIRAQVRNIDRVSFYDMTQYPVLLKAYVKREMRSPSTDVDGYVQLRKGEEVPNGNYMRVPREQRLSTYNVSK